MNKINLEEEIIDKKQIDILIIGNGKYAMTVLLVILDLKKRMKSINKIAMCERNITKQNVEKQLGMFKDFDMDIQYYENEEYAILQFIPGSICIYTEEFKTSIGKLAIEKGIHLFISNPEITITEHKLLDNLSNEMGVVVSIDNNQTYDPLYIATRNKIKEIGEMKYFYSQMSLPSYTNSKNMDYVYFISSVNKFIRPIEVMSTSNPDRDFVVITITWENYITKNSSLSTHSVSWNSDECEKISYTGEFGNFSVDRLQSQVCPGMDLDYNPFFMNIIPDEDGNFAGQNGYGYINIFQFIESVRDIDCGMAVPEYFRNTLHTLSSTYYSTAVFEAGELSIKLGKKVFITYDNNNIPFIDSKCIE